MKLTDYLQKIYACKDNIQFAEGKTVAEFWATCERGDWMMWLLQNSKLCDRRTLTAIKAAQVEPIRHLLTDAASIAALDGAHAFGRGEISEQALNRLANDAYEVYETASWNSNPDNDAYVAAYASHAAYYVVALYTGAAGGASYAAHAASHAAKDSASFYAVKKKYFRDAADTVRKFIHHLKIEGVE